MKRQIVIAALAFAFIILVGQATAQPSESEWRPKRSVIEAWSERRPGFNFDESQVPKYLLPDPLSLQSEDGPPIRNSQEWMRRRRPALLQRFRENVYGVRPTTEYEVEYKEVGRRGNAFGVGATARQIRVTVRARERSHSFDLVIVVPRSEKPVPVIIHINNRYLIPLDKAVDDFDPFWPVEKLVRRGYATAGFHTSHVDPDRRDGYEAGIRSLLDDPRSDPDTRWRSLSAWGWAASRVLDFAIKQPEIDPKRTVVAGNSRAGKTALWAGAEDERFRIVYSNESGCGGAALSRRAFGETVAKITQIFPHWFCARFKSYGGRENELPIDQHELIALIAPRAVYVTNADEYLWADPQGEYASLLAAGAVFDLFGLKHITDPKMPPLNAPRHIGSTGYHIRTGVHNLTEQDWGYFLDFADGIFARVPDDPAATPGPARVSTSPLQMRLSNRAIEATWRLEAGVVRDIALKNLPTGQSLVLDAGHMPRVVLEGGRIVDLARMEPEDGFQVRTAEADPHAARQEAGYAGRALTARYRAAEVGLNIEWAAELRGDSDYVIQSLALTADRGVAVAEVIFTDSTIADARQVGEVDGSVVVCGDIFLAVEHPLARNTVGKDSHVRCALPRGNVLGAGQTWRYTSVFGVVEPGQLRRGFLAYLERRRAHPYRPFLHYNNWYDVVLARPSQRVTEPECLEAIEFFGRELVRNRGVNLDAFVWDDGWDEFNSLWDFHKGFPNGFKKLKDAAARYGAAQGVWMSPWGGYARAKNLRIAFGKSRGYETNASGFSMAGAKYGKAFRDVCLNMMRHQGVVFFKFDGMGGGNKATGARAEMADDVDAVLELTRTLRREDPDVFISATVGTWASPFWTFYADSIWRQGGDTGFHGKGDTRQQWITYRDMYCHDRIVQLGPLYPLNSLMLHGPCISDRRNPSRMVRNEKSVADEIWSFFGSGTNLQELYITPRVMTPTMWDQLAAAAKWSRANSDVLVDTHWIGGSPGNGGVYGWASWQPGKGIVTLRNPSEKPQTFALTLADALELPETHLTDFVLKVVRGNGDLDHASVTPSKPIQIELAPFEVLVLEAEPVTD